MNDIYNDLYYKCGKQMYEAVSRLMKLAEEDNCGAFLALVKENQALPDDKKILFETTVAVGLMARNKADILDKFLDKFSKNINLNKVNSGSDSFDKYVCPEILCHFAGMLIRKQRCREAVKCFILKQPAPFTDCFTDYMLLSAVMVDDLEFFKLLYDSDAYSYYSISLLSAGIFKSKKILDYITGCGGDFLKENMPYNFNFYGLIINKYDFFPIQQIHFSAEEAENDIIFKWLKNIYYMYFSNEPPEKAYKILDHIVKNTGIDNVAGIFYHSDLYFNSIIMRKIFTLKLCGFKDNDLTSFIPKNMPFYLITDELINAVAEIAGDAPFITYEDCCFMRNDEFVIRIAEKLDNTLTVKLIDNFSMYDIEKLQDKVSIEIDAENPKTAEYLRNTLAPHGMMLREQKESIQNAVKYFIDNGFITVEKMAEIASLAQNTDILNMLYTYGDKEKRPAKKTKGA